jgi:hypothetical protein
MYNDCCLLLLVCLAEWPEAPVVWRQALGQPPRCGTWTCTRRCFVSLYVSSDDHVFVRFVCTRWCRPDKMQGQCTTMPPVQNGTLATCLDTGWIAPSKRKSTWQAIFPTAQRKQTVSTVQRGHTSSGSLPQSGSMACRAPWFVSTGNKSVEWLAGSGWANPPTATLGGRANPPTSAAAWRPGAATQQQGHHRQAIA